MKILLTIHDISYKGGGERVVTNLANEFCKIPNFEVCVMSYYKNSDEIAYPLDERVAVAYLHDFYDFHEDERGVRRVLWRWCKHFLINLRINRRFGDYDIIIESHLSMLYPRFKTRHTRYIKIMHMVINKWKSKNRFYDAIVFLNDSEFNKWRVVSEKCVKIPNFLSLEGGGGRGDSLESGGVKGSQPCGWVQGLGCVESGGVQNVFGERGLESVESGWATGFRAQKKDKNIESLESKNTPDSKSIPAPPPLNVVSGVKGSQPCGWVQGLGCVESGGVSGLESAGWATGFRASTTRVGSRGSGLESGENIESLESNSQDSNTLDSMCPKPRTPPSSVAVVRQDSKSIPTQPPLNFVGGVSGRGRESNENIESLESNTPLDSKNTESVPQDFKSIPAQPPLKVESKPQQDSNCTLNPAAHPDSKNTESKMQDSVVLDSARPTPETPPKRLESNINKLISIGRMDNVANHKGFPRLIDAYSRIAREFPQWRLEIIGQDCGQWAILQGQIERLGMSDFIALKPFSADVAGIYRGSEIYVMASHSESLPMVLLEAASFGQPLVAYDIVTIRDCFRDNGILVADGDEDAFCEALKSLMTDENKRKKLGQNGIKLVKERFSKEVIIRQWVGLFGRLVDSKTI